MIKFLSLVLCVLLVKDGAGLFVGVSASRPRLRPCSAAAAIGSQRRRGASRRRGAAVAAVAARGGGGARPARPAMAAMWQLVHPMQCFSGDSSCCFSGVSSQSSAFVSRGGGRDAAGSARGVLSVALCARCGELRSGGKRIRGPNAAPATVWMQLLQLPLCRCCSVEHRRDG